MWNKNQFTQLLKITYPIIQAPMAGSTTPQLVAAVSNAGGLGSLGAALMSPEQTRAAIKEIRTLTNKPFSVNLFIPEPVKNISTDTIITTNKAYDVFRKDLNVQESSVVATNTAPDFAGQIAVVIEEQVPIFSFTFGLLPTEIIAKLKHHKIKIIGTATTMREAMMLERSGVDAIVAQGSEAGGHRGSAFDTNIQDALIGTMALVPQIVDVVKLPVIASGGIMDGRAIVAAFALGAQAAQLGTAFLTCPEASIKAPHRQALLNSTDESTRLTTAFTGKTARSIKNRMLLEIAAQNISPLPFNLHRAMLGDIYAAATQQQKADFLPLWAGQASHLCRDLPVQELMEKLVNETEESLQKFK